MLKIEPIKLLSGSHGDTGITGQGCFMNVIAYLNGEPQITDQSPCVCPGIRPIAIWLNDYLKNDERAQLIPYIERAMGSRTDDKDEIVRRAWLAVKMAEEMRDIAAAANAAAANANAAAAAASGRGSGAFVGAGGPAVASARSHARTRAARGACRKRGSAHARARC